MHANPATKEETRHILEHLDAKSLALNKKDGDQLLDRNLNLDEGSCTDVDDSVSLSISREVQDGIGQIAIQPLTTQENLNSSKRHQ